MYASYGTYVNDEYVDNHDYDDDSDDGTDDDTDDDNDHKTYIYTPTGAAHGAAV